MDKKILLAILAIILFLVPVCLSGVSRAVYAQVTRTGPASDIIEFVAVPADQAVLKLLSGDIDMYIFGLTPSQVATAKGNPNIKFYYAPSGLVDFILNPAPRKDGKLNPFVDKKIRFAINYLVDRDYIIREIYKGAAAPMYTFLSPYDPDFVTIFDIVSKYETPYNPAKADEIITAEMLKLGAKKVNGKWYYNNSPVTINFVIRIEDERRILGDMLASELEKLGFTVKRLYMSFGEAIDTIYYTDPKDHEWDIYTEGWGKTGVEKHDIATISQFGAPWFGYMPGWQVPEWWNYKNDTIDKLTLRIYYGNYSSEAERNEIYRKATEMIIQEAVRIWIATRLEIHIASSRLIGLTLDLGAGLRGLWNLREVVKPGSNIVKIGHLHVWTSRTMWNPVGGFMDVYSVDIWVGVHDPWVWPHPFSGEYMPLRVKYTVETHGVAKPMEIPTTAFMYDKATHSWVPVPKGLKAISKVTFDLSKYIGTRWHNGISISWADILYNLWQDYEFAYNSDKAGVEPALPYLYAPTMSSLIAYEIKGNYLIVYSNFSHFDPNYIAGLSAPPLAHFPWEILAASDYLVFNAKTYKWTPWGVNKGPTLSYIFYGHAKALADAVDKLDFDWLLTHVFTVNGVTYETKEDFDARKAALKMWISEHHHAVISDGPFMLDIFDAEAQYARLVAFRDPTYPFAPGKWVYGTPERPEIVNVGIQPVKIGEEATFLVDVTGPGTLHVKYLVRDPLTARVLVVGDAKAITPTRYAIKLSKEITSKLKPGLYELEITVFSDEVAIVTTGTYYFTVSKPPVKPEEIIANVTKYIKTTIKPDLASLKDAVSSMGDAIKSLGSAMESMHKDVTSAVSDVGKSVAGLSGQISSLSDAISSLSDSVKSISNAIATLNNYLMAIIALVIINIIIAIIAVIRR